jgi:hypothetical protein
MVQTLVQYSFVYRILEAELDKKLCDALTEQARENTVRIFF